MRNKKKIIIALVLIGGIILAIGIYLSIQKSMEEELSSLDVFACTSITGEVLKFNNSPTNNALMITTSINTIKEYIPLESTETLLNKGDNITIYFHGEQNFSVGNIINVNIRCLDGRINSLDLFTKEDCFWESIDNIKNTALCYKKDPGPIINDSLIPPDYEQAKGSSK